MSEVIKRSKRWTVLMLSIGITLLFQNCSSPIQTEQNPPIDISSSKGEGTGTTVENPMEYDGEVFIYLSSKQNLKNSNMNVSDDLEVYMCIEKVEFKKNSLDVGLDKITFKPGLNEVAKEPVMIGSVGASEGLYEEVKLKVKDRCKSKYAFKVVNENGVFETKEELDVRFKGSFSVNDPQEYIVLLLRDLIKALDSIESDKDLKEEIEDFEGKVKKLNK